MKHLLVFLLLCGGLVKAHEISVHMDAGQAYRLLMLVTWEDRAWYVDRPDFHHLAWRECIDHPSRTGYLLGGVRFECVLEK